MIESICVFCGSSIGKQASYSEAAHAFGKELAHHNIKLVYGGGSTGLMGLIADSVLKHGGYAIGVIPQAMDAREVSHPGLQELYIVETMHERKAMMAEKASAFVALPGGLGTFEELFEIITWAQLGIHNKPIAVLNVEGYFDPLLQLIQHSISAGFVRNIDHEIIINNSEPHELITSLQANPSRDYTTKWLDISDI